MASEPSDKTDTNKESVRECPYCGEDFVSRGLFAHVFNTDGKRHAPRDTVPDEFAVEDAEIVGERNVTVENPTEYEVEHKRYICDYCDGSFRGALGLKTHLGRKGGEGGHPEDNNRDIESFESYMVEGDDPATEHDSALMEDLRELRDLFLDDDEKERTVTAYHAYERLDGLIERHSASK